MGNADRHERSHGYMTDLAHAQTYVAAVPLCNTSYLCYDTNMCWVEMECGCGWVTPKPPPLPPPLSCVLWSACSRCAHTGCRLLCERVLSDSALALGLVAHTFVGLRPRHHNIRLVRIRNMQDGIS